jgi:hypothetical protein
MAQIIMTPNSNFANIKYNNNFNMTNSLSYWWENAQSLINTAVQIGDLGHVFIAWFFLREWEKEKSHNS